MVHSHAEELNCPPNEPQRSQVGPHNSLDHHERNAWRFPLRRASDERHVPQSITRAIAISVLSMSRRWIFHLKEIISDLGTAGEQVEHLEFRVHVGHQFEHLGHPPKVYPSHEGNPMLHQLLSRRFGGDRRFQSTGTKNNELFT